LGYYVGNSVSDPGNRVEIGYTSVTWIGGNAMWDTYSYHRTKDNVREDVPGLDFIMKLKPVSYNLNIHRQNQLVYGDKTKEKNNWSGKYDNEQKRMTSFIAQDVASAARSIAYDFSGVDAPKNETDLYSLRYSNFVVPLVEAVQEQQGEIEQLRIDNEQLKIDNEQLTIENAPLKMKSEEMQVRSSSLESELVDIKEQISQIAQNKY
jgi:trimeric autotransporter adhesin